MPGPLVLVKPIAHAFAKKSFFLPVSGSRAPRWRLAKPVEESRSLSRLNALTNACVSTLNRSGPDGDAAMFGRYALLPCRTTLCIWFGNADVGSGVPLPSRSTVKPVTRGARVIALRAR